MSSSLVLDSSAVLAVILTETGGERVAEVLANSTISAVNLSEIVATLTHKEFDETQIRFTLRNLGMKVVSLDDEDAIMTGLLRPATKSHGLSLGDRACLALAQKLDAKVLTADNAWQKIETDIEIELIR